jgi:hypothetical protein
MSSLELFAEPGYLVEELAGELVEGLFLAG